MTFATSLGASQILLTCPDCAFSAAIDPARLPANASTATCPKCGCRFPLPAEDPSLPPEQRAGEGGTGRAGEEVVCPSCGTGQPASPECTKCGLIFARYRGVTEAPKRKLDEIPRSYVSGVVTADAAAATVAVQEGFVPSPEPTLLLGPGDSFQDEEEGRVSILNIIALVMLIDSTLYLMGHLSGLWGALVGEPSLTDGHRIKYLYDIATQAGMFISVCGVFARKEWARIAMICLLGLGLAEGIYMLGYHEFQVAHLEKEMQEGFPELRQNQSGKFIGCFIYAFFIYKLNSVTTKRHFH